jgi:hypothetical protein
MPGPQSHPVKEVAGRKVVGKTNIDNATGKHARHLANRIARGNEDSGGGPKTPIKR